MNNDDHDEDIARAFERLQHVAAPDLWSRVDNDSAEAVVLHGPQRRTTKHLVAAGLVLLTLGVGAFALIDRTSDTTIDTVDEATDVVVDGESAGATAPSDVNDTTGATGPPNEADTDDACDAVALADSLAQGIPNLDVVPTESPRDLVEQSVGVVRGQLLSEYRVPNGSHLLLKVRDVSPESSAEQHPVTNLWTPATDAPTEDLIGLNFVAFLTGEALPVGNAGVSAWPTLVEGLWVACDDSSPAISVLSTPSESGWEDAITNGITLDELWDVAQFPDGSTSEPLGAPVSTDGSADIYDLKLVDGERFRLSLPTGIGDGLVVVQTPDSNGVRLESPELHLTIEYDFCRTPDGMTINPLGMEVADANSETSWVCRSDEMLSMNIERTPSLTTAELALVDLRPIFNGGPYGDALREFWPELRDCSNCSPWGPMIFPEQNVAVNRTGQTMFTAVALDSLAEVWSVDTGGFGSQMHAGADSIYLSDPAGQFFKIAAESGQQLWSIDITEEHAANLSGHAAGRLLLQTSFSGEGDNRAPVLRSIDDQSGEILWTATGRESAEWQFTKPVVLNGLAILMDVYDNPAIPVGAPGGMLRAVDVETGELAWTTDLESSPAMFSSGLLFVAEFENGRALIARTVDGDVLRIDPTNGTILWHAQINAFAIDGTEFDSEGRLALSAVTPAGQMLLNPTSGEVVS